MYNTLCTKGSKGTAYLLILTELKLHLLFSLISLAEIINQRGREGGKLEYSEKTPGNMLQKNHGTEGDK